MNIWSGIRHVLLLLLFTMLLAACAHPVGPIFSDPLSTITGQAEQGDAQAQLYLAQLLEEGAGVARDSKAAAMWYSKSIALGNPKAAYGLAGMYLAGTAVPENESMTVRLLFAAAEKGDSRAQVLLGGLFVAGKAKSEFVAQLNHNRREAAQGELRAMYNLGWMSREGAGVPSSIAHARSWLTQAAEKGFVPAARLLGDIYFAGEGVPKDVSAALHWYGVGVARGDRSSLRRMAELNKQGFVGAHPVLAYSELQPDETSRAYYQLQMNYISSLENKEPVAALTAARRLKEPFPSDVELSHVETRLTELSARQLNPLVLQAEQALSSGQQDAFRNRLVQIVSVEFKEQQLRDLLALYWRRADTAARRVEKEAKEAMVKKREEVREEKRKEPAESTDALMKKGQALLERGKFHDATGIFEKLTRTRGYKHIAMAYVYLGITTLARINPAQVIEAKTLHLKGIASFQNALRFDRAISLPAGYGKYKHQFAEALRQFK
ncbi:MAG: tetratricopeptide repeat protein [Geobacteraceae bacterium]|nr:tetratricopeptide repeat protein [Geobacteraceae bacterium]